jgi:hypothetical protein
VTEAWGRCRRSATPVNTKKLTNEEDLAMPEMKWRLSAEGVQNLDIFGAGMTLRSHVLEGLALPAAGGFA